MNKVLGGSVWWMLAAALVLAGCSDDSDGGGAAGSMAGTAAAGAGGTAAAPAAGMGGDAAGAAAAPAAGMGGDGAGNTCEADVMAMGNSAECAACACAMCANELTALEALDATARPLADAVISCGQTNCCRGTGCYCGDADLVTCATAMPPTGACVAETEAAAGDVSGLALIATPCGDPTTACGAATALGVCLTGDSVMAVDGMCPMCAGATCM